MMKKCILLIIIGLLFLPTYGWGQDDGESQDPIQEDINKQIQVPNSPEAAAFTKYGNIPVNMYNGTANVSIPIYTIEGKEYSFPITLNYDTSGIKVQSIASNVGQNWSLNFAGAVNRQVEGLPDGTENNVFTDELMNLLQEKAVSPGSEYPRNTIQKLINWYDRSNVEDLDFRADTYVFNVNGFSGTLVVDYQSEKVNGKYPAYSIENPRVKVEYETTLNDFNITQWEITNYDGTQYIFNKREITKLEFSLAGGTNEGTRTYNSSWLLTKIISPTTRDVYDFVYSINKEWLTNEEYKYNQYTRKVLLNEPCQTNQTLTPYDVINPGYSKYRISKPYLSEIKYNTIPVVKFQYSNNRKDLEDVVLDKINIMDHSGKSIKEYDFIHSYYDSGKSSVVAKYQYRLKLDTIHVNDQFNNLEQMFRFDYYGGVVPNRYESAGIDLYGYYNGKNNNTLTPRYSEANLTISGADRSTSLEDSKIGILQTIYYPTGGSSTFNYDRYFDDSIQTEEVIREENILELSGGSDPTNTDFYRNEDGSRCDDAYSDLPREQTASFEITEDNVHFDGNSSSSGNVRITSSTTSDVLVTSWQYVAIYKYDTPSIDPQNDDRYNCERNEAGEMVCCLKSDPDNPILTPCINIDQQNPDKTFCELINLNDGSKVYESYFIRENELIDLPIGTYKVFMANGITGKKGFVHTRTKTTQTLTEKKYYGGLRVKEIIHKDNNSIVTKQQYSYEDPIVHQGLIFDNISTQQDIVSTRDCQQNPRRELYLFPINQYTHMPNVITYDKVIESQIGNKGSFLGKTEYYFINNKESGGKNFPYRKNQILNGQIKEIKKYNNQNQLLENTSIDFRKEQLGQLSKSFLFKNPNPAYSKACIKISKGIKDPTKERFEYINFETQGFDGDVVVTAPPECYNDVGGVQLQTFIKSPFNILSVYKDGIYQYKDYKDREISKSYFYTDTGVLQNTITTQTDYRYDNPNHQQVTKTTVTNSKGEVIETSYQYPHDLPSEPYVNSLIAENRIGIPLQMTVKNGTEVVSDQLTEYGVYGDLYLPKAVFSKKGGVVSKTTEDRKLTYDRYDSKGNVLQYHTEDGLTTSIIWGYNGQYPIAKVEGATYDEISSYANNIGSLRAGVPKAMITTYTYEPLVGVTSITDPSGQVQRFEYDDFNRLKRVKDHQGNIIKAYDYHYTTQE